MFNRFKNAFNGCTHLNCIVIVQVSVEYLNSSGIKNPKTCQFIHKATIKVIYLSSYKFVHSMINLFWVVCRAVTKLLKLWPQ